MSEAPSDHGRGLFLTAVYQVGATGGPPPGEHNFFLGAAARQTRMAATLHKQGITGLVPWFRHAHHSLLVPAGHFRDKEQAWGQRSSLLCLLSPELWWAD